MSRGHALVIPKHHGEKLTDIPDDQLAEILPVVKKIVKATGAENYNILQNNGRIAHQEVDHVSCTRRGGRGRFGIAERPVSRECKPRKG